jgi:hypothetical protein
VSVVSRAAALGPILAYLHVDPRGLGTVKAIESDGVTTAHIDPVDMAIALAQVEMARAI